MARADSTVKVNIIGDARDLKAAARDSDKAVSRIGKTAKIAGGAIAGAFAVDAVLDFAQVALGEADRIHDATDQLTTALGGLSNPLIEAAGNMENLGQSRQDVLELEARFVNLGKAAHLTNAELAAAAQPATEAAAALALMGIGGGDAATVLDLIGKAAGGGAKPLKELGIDLSETEVEARALRDTGKGSAEALTENELAAARLALIMEKLQPRIAAVTTGTADLEQSQKVLQARFETLTGRIGEAVEGPLNDLLGWILGGIDGFDILADNIKQADAALRTATKGALGLLDVVKRLLSFAGPLGNMLSSLLGGGGGGRSGPVSGRQGAPHPGIVVQVQGGSPEVIEQSVLQAIQRARGTGRF